MGYDWTAPDPQNLDDEAEIDRIVQEETDQIEKFRDAMIAAHAAISKLEFGLRCPIKGFDWEDFSAMIAVGAKNLPCAGHYQAELRREATDIEEGAR